jgi:hypothetical protein
VAAHIGAALYHHFVPRITVLLRMLTSLKAEAERPMPAQSAAVQPVSLTSVNAGARGELLRRSNSFTASQKM